MTFLLGDLLFLKDDTVATYYERETSGAIIWSGCIVVVLGKRVITNDILVLCNNKLLLVPFVRLRQVCKKL
mgnify:CR=1 FL=1